MESTPSQRRETVSSLIKNDSDLQYFPNGMIVPPRLPDNLKYRPKSEQLKIYAEWVKEIAESGFQTPQESSVKEKDPTTTKDAEKEWNRARRESARKDLLHQADGAGLTLHNHAMEFGQPFVENTHSELESIYNILSHEGLTEQELAFAEQRLRSLIALMEEKLRPVPATKEKTPEDEVNAFMEQLREIGGKKMEEEEREKKKGFLQKISDKIASRPEKEQQTIKAFLKLLEFSGSMSATILTSILLRLSPETAAFLFGIMFAPPAIVSTVLFFDTNESIKRFLGKKGREIDRTRLGEELHKKLRKHPRFAQLLGGHISAGRILPMLQENVVNFLTSPEYKGVLMGLAGYGIFTGIYENFGPQSQGQHILSQTHPPGGAQHPVGEVGGAPIPPFDIPPSTGGAPVPPSDIPLPEIPQSMISQMFPGSDLWNASLELGREWARTGIIPPNPEGHFIPVVNLLKNLAYGLEQTGDGKVTLLNSDLAQEVVRRFLGLLNHQIPIQTDIDRLLIELGTGAPGVPVRHATPEDIMAIVKAFAGR